MLFQIITISHHLTWTPKSRHIIQIDYELVPEDQQMTSYILGETKSCISSEYMSHFAYACKMEFPA